MRFRKEAPVYSAVLIAYLVVITILRWQLEWVMLSFWLGTFFGALLYNADHFAYLLFQSPNEPTAVRLRNYLSKGNFKESLNLLMETCHERKRLVAHSVIFQLVLVVLAFFALSSSNSLFGKGMVIGLFLYSMINQGLLLAREGNMDDWFWQVGFKPDSRGEAFYYLILVLILLYFSRILI